MNQYFIEVGEDKAESDCYCCNQRSFVGHGFIYKNSVAYAVYYVGWSDFHLNKKVSIALAIGSWSDGSCVINRDCFGIEVFEGEEEILLKFIEPDQSPWPETDLLGKMLSRDSCLSHSLAKEVFNIVELIIRNHSSLSEYLGLAFNR